MSGTNRVPPDLPWSWKEFWTGFWCGFGQMAAMMIVSGLLLPIFVDTSSASASSVYGGTIFAVAVSVIYGVSNGDSRVRKWRDGTA